MLCYAEILCYIRICEVRFNGGGKTKGFHLGPIIWVSYIGLWAAGPHNFPYCFGCVPLPLQQTSGSSFSQILLILVDLHLFLPKFLYHLPQFLQLVCYGLLYWPPFLLSVFLQATCSTLMMGLSLAGSDFGTHIPKTWVPSKNISVSQS